MTQDHARERAALWGPSAVALLALDDTADVRGPARELHVYVLACRSGGRTGAVQARDRRKSTTQASYRCVQRILGQYF